MTDVRKILFGLLRFEICGTPITEEVKAAVNKETLTTLYKLSKMHDVAHLLADALHKNGLHTVDKETYDLFNRQHQLAVYRYEQIDYEYKRICETLENAKIPFMPLKGSIIKEYYPEPWMRTSSDIDVLVHPEHLGAAIGTLKRELEYKEDGGFSNEISLHSCSGVHLELHHILMEKFYDDWEHVLSNIWHKAYLKNNTECWYLMTNEMFYFYHIAHMAKHFEYLGGSGIRSIIDTYLLNKCWKFDKEKVEELLQIGKLAAFAITIERLSRIWFEGETYDKLTKDTEDYILRGGVHGTMDNQVALQVEKKGKKGYIFNRIFEPYSTLKIKYPKLQKHKWLYPFYQVKRWCKYIFKRSTRDHAKKEMTAINEVKTVPDLLKRLEL
ncbi:MAG: nucleotidyltransferase family protein [Clostridia bacterium]|nr:nucleotidyltransferase family protein [Clostridia bacterium]